MKSRQKLILVMLFAVALMLTPMSAAWADTSSGEMTATGQTNETVGEGQRIDSFKLDGKFNYKSLGNDSGKPTFTLNTSSIQNIVKDKLLPRWSGLAAGVFRDQAGQLVDLYGYKNNGGCMSQDGFDAYYDRARREIGKYKDENWSCYSLTDKFKQTYPSRAGEQNWDQFVVSGVKQISSLSDARKMMGQAVRDTEKSNPLSVDEILGVDENGEDRLSSLDDDNPTIGFTNILTSINCKGSSKDYDYVSFGIAFYDFEPVPVAAKKLEYVSVGASKETNNKGENSSEITNNQQQDIMHSALLGDSVTETTSTTLSGLASFNLQQNIGANIGMSTTETSSSTSFWNDDTFGTGSETESSSESLSLGMNWGAAWEMGGAMGAEMGHSTSKEVSKAVETTISLPPHTATNTTQTTTTTTYTQNYQQPVILNYKVALFAVSGDFTGAAGGGINPGQYDKQSLVIMFDTKDDTDTSYGCAATDDLYSRVVTNKSVANYDSSNGRTFETHSTASGFTKSNGINWNDVKSYADIHVNVDDLASTNFFYETPGKVSVEQDKTSSNVDELYPLYDLASVRTPKTNYVLYTNNTLNRDSFPLEGYNKYNVAFYGFNPEKWGEWNRCNENGVIEGDGSLLPDDPVTIEGEELVPKPEMTEGRTIYLTWKFKEGAKAKTDEQLKKDGENPYQNLYQDQNDKKIETPVVRIDVVNIALNAPRVNAEGSYKGFYKKPINLQNELTYEVTDKDDKILETQVYWESREPASRGIQVNSGTGDVKFTKPGTYKVRPYVINNSKEKVYSDWLTVTATEHDPVHYDKKNPTCTEVGFKEHYRCSDCNKYFSDSECKNEVTEDDIIIAATGHDWGEWTTTKEATATEPGEQERVCKTDNSHKEKRNLYMVQFNVNGHGAAPNKQTVAHGASVTVPQVPTAAGYTFEGWYTDKPCSEEKAYDFGAKVTKNLTLYAKWTANKYTAAAMAIGEASEDENGELKIAPEAHGTITVDGVDPVTEEGYTYTYKEVKYGETVTLTVTPADGYGLKEIWAIPFKSDSSVGEAFIPNKIGDNKYSFTMPDADVAVLANFAQVTVKYDGNAPEGKEVTGVPAEEKVAYGGTPTKLDNAPTVGGYDFGGWFTDKDCTKPYLKTSGLTEDTTLYAKWKKGPTHEVTYTLLWEKENAQDPGEYTESYQVDEGSTAYDPTEDLYDLAGKDLRAAYELKSKGDTCWFTDSDLRNAFDFKTPITKDTELFAKIVPREYTVTYFNGKDELGTQKVAYNEAIGAIAHNIIAQMEGHDDFNGKWDTEDGAPWNIASNPVTTNLKLYARLDSNQWNMIFDANGGSVEKEKEIVKEGENSLPDASFFTAPEGKCELEKLEVKVGTEDATEKQPGDKITVTADTTVKAIWKDHKWGEWKETTPATIGAEGEEARVCANNEEHVEKRSTDKVDPAPLINGIKAAQDTEKGVKVSEDGKDVEPTDMYTTAAEKKALDDAIEAAQKVANDPKSTQKAVDDAVAAIKKAKETYDAAKKPGKKESGKKDDKTGKMGEDGTAVGKGASADVAEKAILNANHEKDLKGAKYAPLMFKSTKQTKKSIKLTWKKVKGAKKYVIYATPCGKKNHYKKLKTLGASKKTFNVKKVAGKKLKKKTYYKFILVALDKNNEVVSTSKTVHASTKGSKKKANAKGVIVKAKVNKAGKKIKKWKNTSKITLKAGSTPKALVKSTKLKAKIKKAKKTKVRKHVNIRFESTNPKVVTVNAKGKLTAKTKGTAKIYVIAQNGIAKTVKVTVK